MSDMVATSRIISVEVAAARNVASLAMVAAERDVAIRDLIESGEFTLKNAKGPYRFSFTAQVGKIVIYVQADDQSQHRLELTFTPFKRLIKDYFLICESHIEATRFAHADQLQTLDMARRGIHNEGAELVKSLLDSKAAMDFNTARRIFTLICVLQIA